MVKTIGGVYAAAITPRRADGRLDEAALANTLEFLMGRGIRGFAINGATGEYCVTTRAELGRMLSVAREAAAGRAEILCGIGSAGLCGSMARTDVAAAHSAQALLLPMPHFFGYEQDDLESWCCTVANYSAAPVLLYNLPQFATGLEPATVLRVLANSPKVVGVKDSSGSPEILQALTAERPEARRMVGNDAALAEAIRLDICDGVISGVACVLPELILSLFAERRRPESREFGKHVSVLSEFLGAIGPFPVPWALKWIAEVRGLAAATFGQPLSATRVAQGRRLQKWFERWEYAAALGGTAGPAIGHPHPASEPDVRL
jgi:4-hydroxy-tetrahydrodipicolinate synthase